MKKYFFGRINFRPFSFLLVVSLILSCTKSNVFEGKTAEEIKLIKHGQKVYMGTCVVCHNANPKIDGPTGPAIFGSSRELIEHKTLKGGYPKGYKPKRDTHIMPTFIEEHKDDIDAIHAFLNF